MDNLKNVIFFLDQHAGTILVTLGLVILVVYAVAKRVRRDVRSSTKSMELHDFIASALVEVTKEVSEANETLKKQGKNDLLFSVETHIEGRKSVPIMLDVAFTAGTSTNDKVTLSAVNVGANVGKNEKQEYVHRVSIPVMPNKQIL